MVHESSASTSLDRSAVNLAPQTTTTVTMLAAVMGPVDGTRAITVPRVDRSTAAPEALRASVGPASRGPSVSTPPHRRHRRRRADPGSAATAADVKRQPTGLPDAGVHRRGLDDTARSLLALVLLSGCFHSPGGTTLYQETVNTRTCYTSNVYQPTRLTQPCIPPRSLNRVPASAGVKAGMSPLPGGR